jgi:hypothetical protein
MATQFTIPRQVKINVAGRPYAGAQAFFYQTNTETPQAVYQDSALTVLHPQPVLADDDGYFPVIWLDPDAAFNYRVQILSATGSLLDDVPDVPARLISSTQIIEDVTTNLDSLKRTQTEIDLGITPSNRAYRPGNIRRYGAAVDGATDDSAAIRKALDVAARDGTTVTCDPPGQIKVGSVVYIPQDVGNAHRGFCISFYGCTIIGQGKGIGTIFESGHGSVSTGGSSNFSDPDETQSHYATVIKGGIYKSCQYAFRLKNFIYGCELSDMRFEDVTHTLLANRCFASRYRNLDTQVISIGAGDVLYDFSGLTNAIVVQGCSAAGGAANTTGIGYSFGTGGGFVFVGNTAEGLDTGLVLGPVLGATIKGNYFEGLTTRAIDATSSSNREMNIDDNWFLDVGQAINAVLWIGGKWGAANSLHGTATVVINDSTSFCTVEIPGITFSETTAIATALKVPAGYTLGASVRLQAPREVYASAVGFGQPMVIDQTASFDTPAFAYSGGPLNNGTGFWLPFASQTNVTNTSTIDTQIYWSDYRMNVVFDLVGTRSDSAAVHLYGFIFAAGVILRGDSGAPGWAVTASSNSGKLRLVINGTSLSGLSMNGWSGQIRHQ